jgi:hypothetical protein
MTEMVKHERQVGDVSIVVCAPVGVDVARVSVTVRSKDREQFFRSADAVGGLAALLMPTKAEKFAQSAVAYPRRVDGTLDTSVHVALEEPYGEHAQASRAAPLPHPFFGPLAERAEFERVERERQSS